MVASLVDPFERLALDRRQFPQKLIGSERGDLLIVGGARCVWDDVRGLPEPSAVMCVNDIGMYWPGRINHWYSNDVEQLVHWSEGRRRGLVNIFGRGWRLHSCFETSSPGNNVVHLWPFPGQGSSGLVAIFVAIALGYDPITVAGIPFDNSGHFFDPPNDHSLRKDRQWSNFCGETPDRLIERSLPMFRGRVRAISGRLAEVL